MGWGRALADDLAEVRASGELADAVAREVQPLRRGPIAVLDVSVGRWGQGRYVSHRRRAQVGRFWR